MEAREMLSGVPAMPNGPQYNFGTTWQVMSTTGEPNLRNVTAIAMGTDSSVWVGLGQQSQQEVDRYDAVKGVWSHVWTAPQPVISIAAGPVVKNPTGGTLRVCWVVTKGPGAATQINLLLQSGAQVKVLSVPGLPGNAPVAEVAAGAGAGRYGTLWVLNASGVPFVYHQSSQSWTRMPTGGVAITQLTIGSATNVWAVGTSSGSTIPQAYRFNGTGFQRDASLNPSQGVRLLSATSDGTVWAVTADNVVETRPSNPGTWNVVPDASQPAGVAVDLLAASSKYRSAVVSRVKNDSWVLNYGVADQPATGFPSMNAYQSRGFAYINSKLGLASGLTIRDEYANSDYLSQLSDDFTTISGLSRPPGVPQQYWSGTNGIKTEILLEIRCVQGVYQVFQNINSLNLKIEAQASLQLTTVKNAVEVQKGYDNSVIGVFFGPMFNAAVSGIAAAFSGGYAIVAGAIAAGLEDAVSNATGGDSDQQIQLKFNQLDAKIGDVITAANLANGTYEQNILADWGRTFAVGDNVVKGLWNWPAGTSATLANQTVNAFKNYLFQSLMPLKYAIVAFDEFETPWFSQLDVPTYDQYFVPVGTFSNGVKYGTLYVIHDKNSSDDLFTDPGPFPTKSTLAMIYDVIGGTTAQAQAALFTGANGWMPVTVVNG
ncbi:hypothetical protein [Paludisphaera borealis]|uniref:hypothetical protein n=1 Tax=Paludisphaera borealis TaxID=1387353 RepID=UPI002852BA5B|nr:hypothetical protein [Paludisphaera borealis]